MKHPILITRAIRKAQAFAAQLVEAGFDPDLIHISPVMDIVPLPFDIPAFDVALFTSAQGVFAWPKNGSARGQQAVCVGTATTDYALARGFQADCGGQTVAQMITYVRRTPQKGTYVHFRGSYTTGDVVEQLRMAGITASEQIVYDQPARSLSAQAQDILQGGTPVVLPLFSPRSARLLIDQTGAPSDHIAVCISPAVEQICNAAGFRQVQVASAPTAADMVKAIARWS